MNATTNPFSEKKLIEQLVTPEKMSPAFVAACECSTGEEQLSQDLEYLWDDCDSSGKSYEMYLRTKEYYVIHSQNN
jgi:hypothetical protein